MKNNMIKKIICALLVASAVVFGIVLFLWNSVDYYHQKYPMFLSNDDLNNYLKATYWTDGDKDYEFGDNSVDVYYSDRSHVQKTTRIVSLESGKMSMDAIPYSIKPKEGAIVSSDGSVRLTQISRSEKKDNAYTLEETAALKAKDEKKAEYKGYAGSGTTTSTSSYSTSISDDDKLLCWLVTEEYVKSQLKSPSSAKFPSTYTSSDISYSRSGTTYTVRSYVDADNSYGANIRQYFTIQIEIIGDKNRVVSCVFD